MKKLLLIIVSFCIILSAEMMIAATRKSPTTQAITIAYKKCLDECSDNYTDGREKEECVEQCDWDKSRTRRALNN